MTDELHAVRHEAWTAAVGILRALIRVPCSQLQALLRIQIPVRLTLSPGEVTVAEGPPAPLHVRTVQLV